MPSRQPEADICGTWETAIDRFRAQDDGSLVRERGQRRDELAFGRTVGDDNDALAGVAVCANARDAGQCRVAPAVDRDHDVDGPRCPLLVPGTCLDNRGERVVRALLNEAERWTTAEQAARRLAFALPYRAAVERSPVRAGDPDSVPQGFDPVGCEREIVQYCKPVAADGAVLRGPRADRKPLTRIGQ